MNLNVASEPNVAAALYALNNAYEIAVDEYGIDPTNHRSIAGECFDLVIGEIDRGAYADKHEEQDECPASGGPDACYVCRPGWTREGVVEAGVVLLSAGWADWPVTT